MKKIFTLIFIIYSMCLDAQIIFQKTYGGINGDEGRAVQQTVDGGYIIMGTTASYGNGIYLLKTDPFGDIQWAKTFGGPAGAYGYSVEQTLDGGYIVIGGTYSFGAGNADIYLVKTDSNGDTLWTKTIGGPNNDHGYSGQQTTDGGYIITGVGSFSMKGIYLIKTDAGGSLLWTKIYGGAASANGLCVQQTSDGGYILSGETTGSGPGSYDVYLIKTDSVGDTLWTKTYGGTNTDEGYSVRQTSDKGYIIAGNTRSFGPDNQDIYLIKTDVGGTVIWSKKFTGAYTEYAYCVRQTFDGGYVIAGMTQSFGPGAYAIYLLKTDTAGNLLWIKTYGGANINGGYFVQQTLDGGYVIAGRTNSFGAGNMDVYLIKTDSMGNSGCYQENSTIITTIPTTITSNVGAQISSGGIAGNPPTVIGNGGVATTVCFVGIESAVPDMQPEIIISPNPATSELYVNGYMLNEKSVVEIYDMLGQKRLTPTLSKGEGVRVDVSSLSAGIYFVRVTCPAASGKTSEGMSAAKFVKE
jgi:hypothetical protein